MSPILAANFLHQLLKQKNEKTLKLEICLLKATHEKRFFSTLKSRSINKKTDTTTK